MDDILVLAESKETGPVDVVSGAEHTHHSSTPPRCSEYNSRCKVSVMRGRDRLETEPCHITKDRPDIWSTGDSPIHLQADNPVPTLLQLAARSVCISHRCLPADLDRPEGVCQPSLEPHRQGSSKYNDNKLRCHQYGEDNPGSQFFLEC